MPANFNILRDLVLRRRNVKPEFMNGKVIPDEEISELLEMANWAPTHGHTEPWRMVVFTGDGLRQFSEFHAELYRKKSLAEGAEPVKYDRILHRTDNVSHLIALGMKQGDHPKIPAQEEHAAAAIAAYIIWLGSTGKDIACYWGSGGMTYTDEMKDYLGLTDQDEVLGFLYLGYTDDAPRPGKRLTGMEQKVRWVR